MDILNQIWEKSNLPIPKNKLLTCNNITYAVVDDRYSIITAISRTNIVYAIAKSKIKIMNDSRGFNFYWLEDTRDLRVISCSESSIKDNSQKFVINEIIPLIKK
jgi:hypothetical protein